MLRLAIVMCSLIVSSAMFNAELLKSVAKRQPDMGMSRGRAPQTKSVATTFRPTSLSATPLGFAVKSATARAFATVLIELIGLT